MSDLLPPNASPQERALALAVTEPFTAIPDPFRDVWNPDTCPPALLPWLAWAMSVDDWDTSWSEARKRAVIKASLAVHQHKGTIGALKRAFSSLGYDIAVREWFEQQPAGDTYTFKATVTVEQVGIPDPSAFDTIVTVANNAKNLRSHMIGVDVLGRSRAGIHIAAAALAGEIITISAEPSP